MNRSIFVQALMLTAWIGLKAQEPKAIVEKATDRVTFDSFEMVSKLTIYDNKGNQRARGVETYSKKYGADSRIKSVFTTPSDIKGTTILIYDYPDKNADMWIYLPATRKTRRIASNERNGSFMGSEFSNANMSTPTPGDYEFKLMGAEFYENNECYKIKMTGKSPEIQKSDGFASELMWIDKTDNLNRKTEYLDASDKLLKTQTFSQYQKQRNGKYFCMKLEMTNNINGRRSVIEISDFKPDCTRNETFFSPASLDK